MRKAYRNDWRSESEVNAEKSQALSYFKFLKNWGLKIIIPIFIIILVIKVLTTSEIEIIQTTETEWIESIIALNELSEDGTILINKFREEIIFNSNNEQIIRGMFRFLPNVFLNSQEEYVQSQYSNIEVKDEKSDMEFDSPYIREKEMVVPLGKKSGPVLDKGFHSRILKGKVEIPFIKDHSEPRRFIWTIIPRIHTKSVNQEFILPKGVNRELVKASSFVAVSIDKYISGVKAGIEIGVDAQGQVIVRSYSTKALESYEQLVTEIFWQQSL